MLQLFILRRIHHRRIQIHNRSHNYCHLYKNNKKVNKFSKLPEQAEAAQLEPTPAEHPEAIHPLDPQLPWHQDPPPHALIIAPQPIPP